MVISVEFYEMEIRLDIKKETLMQKIEKCKT